MLCTAPHVDDEATLSTVVALIEPHLAVDNGQRLQPLQGGEKLGCVADTLRWQGSTLDLHSDDVCH